MKYVELRYQDPRTKTYLGSPSLVILPDGALLASHDYFNGIKNHNGESCLTSIYRSEDGGQTWQQITHIIGAFWMTMFTIGNSVYGIANSQEYGDVVIRRSDDGGFTWTTPEDENNGVLLRSGPKRVTPNYQITPGTTIIDNRIYLPLDDLQTYPGGGWNGHRRPPQLRAPHSGIPSPVPALRPGSSKARSTRAGPTLRQRRSR